MIGIYMLLAFLIFLGLLVGIILGYIAPEELNDGAQWFIKIQDTSFLLLISLLGYHSLTEFMVLLLILFLLFYWFRGRLGRLDYLLEFTLLGIIYGIAYIKELFTMASVLLVIYLIASGCLMRFKLGDKRLQISKQILYNSVPYFIGAYLPFFFANL